MRVIQLKGLDNAYVSNKAQDNREARVKKNSPILPPFVMLASASRNSGKSTMVVNLVKHIGKKGFDNIFLLCPTVFNQSTFDSLNIPEENIYADMDGGDLEEIFERIEGINADYRDRKEKIEEMEELINGGAIDILRLPEFYSYYTEEDIEEGGLMKVNLQAKLKQLKRDLKRDYPLGKPTHLIIFDDCQGSKKLRNSALLTQRLIQHRHHGISMVFLTQSSTAVPPYVRNNPSVVAVFNQKNKKELDRIHEENLSMFERDDLQALMDYAHKEPYQFLMFNFDKPTAQGLPEVRHNFNKILMFDSEDDEAGKG